MNRKSCAAKRRNHVSNPLLASVSAALIAAVMLSGSAMADRPPRPAAPGEAPAKGGELEEIIVTAEKRESTVQATPIAMTALVERSRPGEHRIDTGLVGAIPHIAAHAGPARPSMNARLGLLRRFRGTVGFYLDETPLSASAVALNGRTVIDADLYDQPHRGAAWTSGNAVRCRVDGGTIKLVTNPPSFITCWVGRSGRFPDHRRQH